MATVIVTPTAIADLDQLITTHTLPADTIERFKQSVTILQDFPQIGAPLHGRWAPFRFVLGPWRWMLVIYIYDVTADRVAIVTVQDTRSGDSATSERRPASTAAG